MTSFLCKTCATQFPESDDPPAECPICSDERQYLPEQGQQWIAYDEVRAAHRAEIRDKQPGLTGIGMEPQFAIGQRALLVESPGGNVLWDWSHCYARTTRSSSGPATCTNCGTT